MKILVVGLVENEQVDRLWQEAYKRGHNLVGCYTKELTVLSDTGSFNPTLRGKKLDDFNLIYFWAPGTRRWDWYAVGEYLHSKFKTILVNEKIVDPTVNYNPSILKDYLLQSQNSIPYPKSAVIYSVKSLESVAPNFTFPLIVKLAEGKQGKSVYKADSKDDLHKIVGELESMKQGVVLREFIPNDGDVRVFTIGYKAVGAMKRIPKKGEFRSNISQGGRGEKFDLNKYPEIRDIAEKASRVARVEIAGVDVIINKNTGKPYVLEVNPGPQFLGIEKYTKVNIALEIINYFEKLYSER